MRKHLEHYAVTTAALAFGVALATAGMAGATQTAGQVAIAGAGGTTTTTTTAVPTTTTAVPTTTGTPKTNGVPKTTAVPPADRTAAPTKGPKDPARFSAAQAALQAALQLRVTQLGKLSTDVQDNAKVLSPSEVTTLTERLQTEGTNMANLSAEVKSATKWAQLRQDRRQMIFDNRVFVVMTPQVFETIEASSIGQQVTSLESQEQTLQAEVSSLSGQPGGKDAATHYAAFVKLVNMAATTTTGVVAKVLAVVPQQWPGAEHTFVDASRALLRADVGIAHAEYDASVIGLAAGGYTGP